VLWSKGILLAFICTQSFQNKCRLSTVQISFYLPLPKYTFAAPHSRPEFTSLLHTVLYFTGISIAQGQRLPLSLLTITAVLDATKQAVTIPSQSGTCTSAHKKSVQIRYVRTLYMQGITEKFFKHRISYTMYNSGVMWLKQQVK